MKTKYLKNKGVIYLIQLWGHMDETIRAIKNKKIYTYWKKHCIPSRTNGVNYKIRVRQKNRLITRDLKYSDICGNRYFYEAEFLFCDFDKIWSTYRNCICMSMDNDVEEYLNCLNVLDKSKKYIKHNETYGDYLSDIIKNF